MKNLSYFINKTYRKILIWLFLGPQTAESLSRKCRINDTDITTSLNRLIDAGLVERLHQQNMLSIYRLRPTVRQKTGRIISRLTISVLFFFVAKIITATDKTLDKRQIKRLQKRNWQ